MSLPYKALVPANIAFLKYWGKRDVKTQWPANHSLSMSLAQSVTTTSARVLVGASEHQISFSGTLVERTSSFGRKAYAHLDYLAKELGTQAYLQVNTSNSFPTGCGIASSASGFGALTLAAVAAWQQADSLDTLEKMGFTRHRLAALARMGSGSSCRSFWGGYVSWKVDETTGEQELVHLFSDEHWDLADTIAIFSASEKKVSSSKAHLDAWSSPLFEPRLAGIGEKEEQMINALRDKDLSALGPLLEQEALEMHAVMMSAKPSTCYLSSESISFISWLRKLRQKTGLAAYFTIDAGPNIHVICEQQDQSKLHSEIKKCYPQLDFIVDHVGKGPQLVVEAH
ncbi:MAG: diphosphomevalonate decarboxylase [Oligoflexales bacterium]|nr:diphosphomevalonate decarboxylase [Oligoflexales bacterium]